MSIFAHYFLSNTKMSCILHIETSTNVCSVAVSHDGTVIFEKEDFSGPNHAEQLGVYVDEALSFIDQSLVARARNGKETLLYGGDWDDRPHDGIFCGDGIVFGDGDDQPAAG